MGVLVAGTAVGLLLVTTLPAGASTVDRYQVRRGDTLSGIAARLGVNARRLASSNGLGDPDLVIAGTWLRIPTGGDGGGSASGMSSRRTVLAGETLSGIAARYGLAASTLAGANGISDPNRVIAGTRLRIPSAGGGTSSGRSVGGTGSLPRRLRTNPTRLALVPVFDHWAARYGVPADLLKAVTWLESGWQTNVVSSTGAVGIGQLMPATVVTMREVIGLKLSPWVPDQNIRMSARYLALLMTATGGNTAKALAGYYQGLASVAINGVYPSTLSYINGVMTLRGRFG